MVPEGEIDAADDDPLAGVRPDEPAHERGAISAPDHEYE
jgi:hypothetical protein